MTDDVDNLLDKAFRLSVSERAILAAELTASLDQEDASAPIESDPAWLAEIERRIREVKDGTAKTQDWATVEQELLERLRARRA